MVTVLELSRPGPSRCMDGWENLWEPVVKHLDFGHATKTSYKCNEIYTYCSNKTGKLFRLVRRVASELEGFSGIT